MAACRYSSRPGSSAALSRRVRVDDRYALLCLAHLLHHRSVAHDRTQRFGEGVWDAVHAADWLEHRRLPVELLFIKLAHREIRDQKLVQLERRTQLFFVRTCARADIHAAAFRARELVVLVEIAVSLQEGQHLLRVFLAQSLIEPVLVDALRQQFRYPAARIVDHLPLFDWLAAVQILRLHQGAARGVDLDLERHTQFFAVTQDGAMNRGQARRPGIHVVFPLPVTGLDSAVGELNLAAVTEAPAAAAGPFARLEHDTFEARLAQFIGGDEARDTRLPESRLSCPSRSSPATAAEERPPQS